LYVGDAKMSALATRAFIQAAGDYYLTPLPQTGEVPELLTALLEPVWGRQQRLERIYSVAEDDSEQPATLLGVGYQTVRTQVSTVDGQPVTWQERVLVVYSPTSARRTRRGLAERLEKAKQALHGLTPTPGRGHRQWHDLPALQANAQAILKHYRVEGLLEVSYQHEATQRTVRQYGAHPARTEEQARYVVQVARNYAAIRAARRHLGWRLYVTNTPVAELSLAKAVVAYRGAPNIERGFHRLKGHPLGLSPVYVQREDHAKGLARLLSLGLRVLTLVEHKVRQELKSAGQMLQGLHTGNLHRPSKRPTAERLLAAFEGITLTIVHLPDQTIRHITPLSALQRRILELLGLPVSIYESLTQVAQPIPP
jgi:transposase